MTGNSSGPHLHLSHATYVACGLKWLPRATRTSLTESCHVCGMWIEMTRKRQPRSWQRCHATYVACGLKLISDNCLACAIVASCHVCGMWIEISEQYLTADEVACHATYVACGLKWLPCISLTPRTYSHATYVACGLKLSHVERGKAEIQSCHVCGMWIEMPACKQRRESASVMPRMWHVD